MYIDEKMNVFTDNRVILGTKVIHMTEFYPESALPTGTADVRFTVSLPSSQVTVPVTILRPAEGIY